MYIRIYYDIRDSLNTSVIYDFENDIFIKSFEFDRNYSYEVINEDYFFATRDNGEIEVYSLDPITTSVAPPIDDDLFDELLNSNKPFKVFDINGNELFEDVLNNKVKYQKLKSGRYFIQTEEKTYKIIKR